MGMVFLDNLMMVLGCGFGFVAFLWVWGKGHVITERHSDVVNVIYHGIMVAVVISALITVGQEIW